MEKYRPLLFFVLLAGLILFGLVFWQFIVDDIIVPVALVVWLFLRLFVLSIDQQVYWWALVLLGALLLLIRLFAEMSPVESLRQPSDSNAVLDRVAFWKTSILGFSPESWKSITIRRDLIWLLAGLYATRQPGSLNFEIEEILRERRIPLPEPVYAFLFAQAPPPPPPFFKHPLESIRHRLATLRQAPQKWIHRWSGREKADYYVAIDQVLTFMENSLEIKNDDEPFDPHDH